MIYRYSMSKGDQKIVRRFESSRTLAEERKRFNDELGPLPEGVTLTIEEDD